jgi:polyisoprenoid-binding protein YceI
MNLRTLLPAALGLSLLGASLSAATKVLTVDTTHTVLGFRASTLLFDVPGRFTRYRMDISGDPASLEGFRVRVDIDARSVDTGNRTRDEHLRSPDFFNVARFPRIIFESTQAKREGDSVIVRGTLNLHGITKDLELPFRFAQGMNGAGEATWSYRASLPLDRIAYGVGAESVAAKISLKNQVELDLLLVGAFVEPTPPAPRPPAKAKRP